MLTARAARRLCPAAAFPSARRETVSRPRDFDAAWSRQYARLAREFCRRLPEGARAVVELGCGRGQLTIPLARLAPRVRIVGVDLFPGPYSGGHRTFGSAVAEERLRSRVRLERGDALARLARRRSRTCDAAISNEFLGELDVAEAGEVLAECHRILRPGGATVHGFLSPLPRNEGQRLVIESNVDLRWTKTPPKAWLSPPPEFVVAQLERAGFRRIRTVSWTSELRVTGEAARELLERWNVRDAFWDRHEERLTTEGLEIPDWILVTGQKAR